MPFYALMAQLAEACIIGRNKGGTEIPHEVTIVIRWSERKYKVPFIGDGDDQTQHHLPNLRSDLLANAHLCKT